MGQHNIIELNGKRYDAITGAFLGVTNAKPHLPGTPVSQRGRVIDGFIRKPQTVSQAPTTVKPAAAQIATPTAITSLAKKYTPKTTEPVKRVARKQNAPHVQAHLPERPKTLMRHAVHKPHVSMKPAIKTQVTTGITARPVSEIAIPLEKKLSVTQVDPIRLARAKHIARSHHIRRFAAQPRHAMPAQVAPVAVHPVPTTHSTQQTAAPSQTIATAQPMTAMRPAARHTAGNARIARASLSTAAVVRRHTTTPAKKEEPLDVFEAAIAHARSHEQSGPIVPKRRNRILNWAAGLGAFLLIGGFIAYLNMNTIELQIASVRAGFSAEMPSYQPTGYALGPVRAAKGSVSLSFRSGDSSYKITQQASDWDSQTLYENYVAAMGGNPETVESKGRTIYIYKGNNATWVNGGIRYEITGDAALTSDELVALATSM